MNSTKRAAMDRVWWDELKSLDAADDVSGFYRRYAEYLKWNNIISERRQILHRMAVRAAELLARKITPYPIQGAGRQEISG